MPPVATAPDMGVAQQPSSRAYVESSSSGGHTVQVYGRGFREWPHNLDWASSLNRGQHVRLLRLWRSGPRALGVTELLAQAVRGVLSVAGA